jgi:two-component system sensor histidine kinase UhpB
MRAMLKTLRPHGLHASGLAQTLCELVDGWRGRSTGIEFTVSLQSPVPDVTDMAALTLYRVVQEALTNVVRHSGARHCAIVVASTPTRLRVEVTDDGCGLPPAGVARRGGLLGMMERVDMAGGQLELLANPAGGLRLVATLPVQDESKASTLANEGALA